MPKRNTAARSTAKRLQRKPARRTTKFINVAVSEDTRAGLHLLKGAMKARSQAVVIARLVAIGVAIYRAEDRARVR